MRKTPCPLLDCFRHLLAHYGERLRLTLWVPTLVNCW